MAAPKPIWVRQAEEAKLKSEADTTAAAKAAFDATFQALSASAHADQPPQDPEPFSSSPAAFPDLRAACAESDSDSDDNRPRASPGPVDPAKSSAAGASATFTVVGKDRAGRRVTSGGARIRVRVCPVDNSDSSYLDPFSAATAATTSTYPTMASVPTTTSSAYPNMVNQTMPNYVGSLTSGAFPSLLGLIPSASTGASGGVVRPAVGASLGEICREHISGKCTKGTDCRFSHPPQQLLMSVMAATRHQLSPTSPQHSTNLHILIHVNAETWHGGVDEIKRYLSQRVHP